jgi:SHS2 domain-containing protein
LSGYKQLEHMTDAKVEAYGPSLEGAFESAAMALEDLMVDIRGVRPRTEERLVLSGRDREELLYEWLEALISRQETQGMLYSNFHCEIWRAADGTYELAATIAGEKFDPNSHEQKTAVKAPTYHEMEIAEDEKSGRTVVRFLLDL